MESCGLDKETWTGGWERVGEKSTCTHIIGMHVVKWSSVQWICVVANEFNDFCVTYQHRPYIYSSFHFHIAIWKAQNMMPSFNFHRILILHFPTERNVIRICICISTKTFELFSVQIFAHIWPFHGVSHKVSSFHISESNESI